MLTPTPVSKRFLGSTVTSAAATPLLTTAQAKSFLNVVGTDSDTLIDSLVEAATATAEKFTRRAFITQTVVTRWEASELPLVIDRSPVQSLTGVTTYDFDGDSSVEASPGDLFYVQGLSSMRPKLAWQADGDAAFTADEVREIHITTVNGFGDAASDVPSPIINAVRLILSQFYDRRDDFAEGKGLVKLPFGSRALLAPFQLPLI